jgi:competence protein ComEC
LIVTTRDAPPDCAAAVIGRDVWRKRGALALRRDGSSFVIEGTRPPNYDRPWAPAQRARRTEGGTALEGSANPSAPAYVPPRDATPRPEEIQADD